MSDQRKRHHDYVTIIEGRKCICLERNSSPKIPVEKSCIYWGIFFQSMFCLSEFMIFSSGKDIHLPVGMLEML